MIRSFSRFSVDNPAEIKHTEAESESNYGQYLHHEGIYHGSRPR